MENIFIIGARKDGHAKVVLEIIQAQGVYNVVGFIDDALFETGATVRGIPIIGKTNDLERLKDIYKLSGGIVAIGNNPQRRILASKIKALGFKLINAIHPTVHIDSDVMLGEGNVLCQGAIIVTGSILKNCINIHTGATIDHDNIIENGANLGPGVHIAGRVKIGEDAFLGAGTIVIPDVIIGEGVVAGAGTVIIDNLQPFVKVVGVPARIIEYLNKS